MKYLFTLIILSGLFFYENMLSQSCPPPQSKDLIMLDNMDHDNLYPLTSPDDHYSDVWGYVAGGREYGIIGGRDSIFIEDVTDPLNIVTVAVIFQGDISLWRDFKVYSHYLYSITDNGTSTDNGVVIYDLSGLPSSVTKVNQLDTQFGRCHNIFVDEANARLYAVGMPGSTDICVYELTDPADPALWGCYDLDTIAGGSSNGLYIHDIFVKDNIAYCGHGYSGYYIWDMNDKMDVKVIGSLTNSSFNSGYVHSSWNFEDDSKAIVATEVGINPYIYIVDQSDPANPVVESQWKQPLLQCADPGNQSNKRPHNPYIVGDNAYISFYHDGVQVLDLNTVSRVRYYDTYPDNTDYSSGFPGCWGVYPFLPSGTILASDRKYGLYTLVPGTCNLDVTSTNGRGSGTLDAAIACSGVGETVTLSTSMANNIIDLSDIGWTIYRDLTIQANPADNITVTNSGDNPVFSVPAGIQLTLKGFTVLSTSPSTQTILNEGSLIIENMNVQHTNGKEQIINSSSGQLTIIGQCNLKE